MQEIVLWRIQPTATETEWDSSDGAPTIRVDTSADLSGFPQVHPGVHDASGGYRTHRTVIQFRIKDATCARLRLDFVAERGPCPDLTVSLDGEHTGLFHPKVRRADRSETGKMGPVVGPATLEIDLPAAWLTAGDHELTIATVFDEASALGERGGFIHDVATVNTEEVPPAHSNYGYWFGSFICWTELSLLAVRDTAPVAPVITVHPTPFFITVAGEVRELVDVQLDWAPGSTAPRRLTVEWTPGQVETTRVPGDRAFGQFRWRLVAPATFVAETTVRVTTDAANWTFAIVPSRKWTLHLIPHIHLDLGFTDRQGKVLELHCRNIDRALDLIDSDPGFRFNIDGNMMVDQYSATRSPAQFERLLNGVRDGKIGVNALHSNLLTGVTSLAELDRAVTGAARLPVSSTTGLRYANLTDVPTASPALPSILKRHGIDGFVGMANHHRASTTTSDDIHLISPVRWRGPDGAEVLAHFADHYSQLRFIAGDPQSIGAATNGFSRFLGRYERTDYLPADLPIIGTHADNEDLGDGDTNFVGRWNAVFAFPRITIATFDEYLAAVAPLREQLPLWLDDSGSYWEDGFGAAAQQFGTYRETQARLPATETLGAALTLRDERFRTARSELDRAWEGMAITSEHTFTWARSIAHPHGAQVSAQLGWKQRFTNDAARVAADEQQRHLGRLLESEKLVGPGVLAVNPLPWTADLTAVFELIDGSELLTGGEALPVEVLDSCAGLRTLRTTMRNMPAHSYRYFPVGNALSTVPAGETPAEPTTAPKSTGQPAMILAAPLSENEFVAADWRFQLDPISRLPMSAITPNGREILDGNARWRLGQLVRTVSEFAPAFDPTAMESPSAFHSHERHLVSAIDARVGATADCLRETSAHLTFDGATLTYDGVRLRWHGDGEGLSDVQLDMLFVTDPAAIEVDVRFLKRACLDMEGVYLAFPFSVAESTVRYERQLGWTEPARDHGPGASNEWGALNNSLTISDDHHTLVWTPRHTALFTVGDIVRGTWPEFFHPGSPHVFAYLTNNYWPCNIPPATAGEHRFSFRLDITETPFDESTATRLGQIARLGAQTTDVLELDRFAPNQKLESREGTFLILGADLSTDVRVRETTHGDVILDVINLSAEPHTATLTLPAGWVTTNETDDDRSAGQLVVELARHGMASITLQRV